MTPFTTIQRLGRGFATLVALNVASLLSMMIGRMAVAWWIVQAGSAADLGSYVAAGSVASVLFFPALSPLLDRIPKRRLVLLALIGMSVECAALASMAQWSAYRLWAVIALSLFGVASSAVLMPSLATMAAELLPASQLTDGLGAQKSAQAIGRLLGPVLAGLLLASGDIALALWVQLLLVALAALVSLLLPDTGRSSGDQDPQPAKRSWSQDLVAGLRAKWSIRIERAWTCVAFFGLVFVLPGIGMLVPLKLKALGFGGGWLATCEGGLSLGYLCGALGGAKWLSSRLGRARSIVLAVGTEALCMLVIGMSHSPLLVALALAALGFGVSTVQLAGQTHRLLAIPKHFRGRLTAADLAVAEVATLLGASAAAVITTGMTVHTAYLLFGLALLAVALGYTTIPGYGPFLRLSPEEVDGYYGRTHPALFPVVVD